MRTRLKVAVFFLLCVASGCQTGGRTTAPAGARVPLFAGLGRHHRAVTTSSSLAQQYFDQGLVWAYAFNHDEAIRSFEEATRQDPNCAMAYWGIALCNGPHINNPKMTPERSKAAWAALQKAVSLKDRGEPAERAMISALEKRYADPAPEDRKALDEAYAAAMRDAWNAQRDDPDIGSLFAEAMMDLRPWDLWTHDRKPQPGTEEIVAVLEQVLRVDPMHPGANHLNIHALEASAHPERAIPAADRIRQSVPGAGHLVHMPSHIDVLTGQWAKASRQNELAIHADATYRKISPKQDFYRVYMTHNQHMLAFAAMMEGRSETALRAARDIVAGVPREYGEKQAALVDPSMAIPYEVLTRFGRWDEVLKEPAPPSYWPITNALWRFTRGVAFAAKGKVAEADAERVKFRSAAAQVSADAMMAINPAQRVFGIAEHMLNGEIAYRRGNLDEAVKELQEAIRFEDSLQYMEPPEWIQPVRHALGAMLVSGKRYEEAEKVYRDDLRKWPENGWSLLGLSKCLRARGAHAEAEDVEKRFRAVWSRSDVQIGSSCLCVPGGV